MKYYKYPNPYITDAEIATEYIEVHSDVIMRQLSVFQDHTISSNVDLLLADKPFEYEDTADIDNDGRVEITVAEFDAAWQKHLQQNEIRWIEAKALYPINKSVIGCMKIFFPQGIIVQLAPNILGVADYRQARATTSPEFVYTGIQLAGVVTGYDETNQWIGLGSPKIHADKGCNPNNWHSPT